MILRTYILDDNYDLVEITHDEDVDLKFADFAAIFNSKSNLPAHIYPRIGWYEEGEVTVSTVMLPFDYNSAMEDIGDPKIFETMIFGGPYNDYQERYSTYRQAVEGHVRLVNMVKSSSSSHGNNKNDQS